MKRVERKACDWELVHKVASKGYEEGVVTLAYIELLERGNWADVGASLVETPKAKACI